MERRMSDVLKPELASNVVGSFVWPYSLFPWQQQFTFPSPIPLVVPSAQTSSAFAQSAGKKQHAKKHPDPSISHRAGSPKSRRFSDPGPYPPMQENENGETRYEVEQRNTVTKDDESMQSGNEDESLDESRKDGLFLSLLQELNATRNVNCQLMLELNKMKLQLEVMQSENKRSSESQPGYVAALAQRLFDAHQLRSESLAYLNQAAQPRFDDGLWGNGYRAAFSRDKVFECEDPEQQLLKEKEILFNRLQATERKLQQLRLPFQWMTSTGRDDVFHSHPHWMRKQPLAESGRPSSSSPKMGGRATAPPPAEYFASSAKLSPYTQYNSLSSTASGPTSIDDVDLNGHVKQGSAALGASPGRRLHETMPTTATRDAASYDASATEIQRQMALLERERRHLQHEYHTSVAALKVSEERATKLERLVSVLRKKLDSSTGSTISVTSANEAAASSLEASGHRLTSIDGPGSLPSYTVGPITQL